MHFDPQSNVITTEAEVVDLSPKGAGRAPRTAPVSLVLTVCAVLIGGLMWLSVGPGVKSTLAAGGFELPKPVRFAFSPRETPEPEADVTQERPVTRSHRVSAPAVTRTLEPAAPAGSKLVNAGRVHYFRGREYLTAGRIDDAVAELIEATRLAPEHADAHYKLGLAYVGLRDHAGAQQELALLEKLDPSLASLLGNLVQ